MAWEEARTLSPKPALLVFAAFQFDPEAAKDIDELTPEKTGMTFLKVQMNPDLLTDDLKKKRASNESFWLMGQPEVELRKVKDGEHAGKWPEPLPATGPLSDGRRRRRLGQAGEEPQGGDRRVENRGLPRHRVLAVRPG